LAASYGVSPEEVAAVTEENVQRLFQSLKEKS